MTITEEANDSDRFKEVGCEVATAIVALAIVYDYFFVFNPRPVRALDTQSGANVIVDEISGFERDHGILPDSLDSLVPSYLSVIPKGGYGDPSGIIIERGETDSLCDLVLLVATRSVIIRRMQSNGMSMTEVSCDRVRQVNTAIFHLMLPIQIFEYCARQPGGCHGRDV